MSRRKPTPEEQQKLDDFYQRVGQKILFHRERRGMTQKEFANKLGVTRYSVIKLEHGKTRFIAYLLYRIAHILEVGLSDLGPQAPEGW